MPGELPGWTVPPVLETLPVTCPEPRSTPPASVTPLWRTPVEAISVTPLDCTSGFAKSNVCPAPTLTVPPATVMPPPYVVVPVPLLTRWPFGPLTRRFSGVVLHGHRFEFAPAPMVSVSFTCRCG